MPLKVLYIGYFHDGTGWAQGAIRNVLALDAAGVDVVCRTVKLNQRVNPPPARILELEQKPIGNPDVSIQHLLPPMLEANQDIPWNIACCYVETDGLPNSTWQNSLLLMDEVWATCTHNQNVFKEVMTDIVGVGNLQVKTKQFPIPTNTGNYMRSWPVLPALAHVNDRFVFYSIQEFTRRKNFATLLAAWHSEFYEYDNVELVLKVTERKQELQMLNERIKRELKLPKRYRDPIIIDGRMSDDDIMSLHNSCDCFVTCSHGEAWSIPTMDALGMGSTPIVPSHTGFEQYLNDDNAFMCPAQITPVIGAVDTFDEIYTADENWYRVDIADVRKAMRHIFELSPDRRRQLADKGRETALEYDFLTIGNRMRKHLEDGRKEARCFAESCECTSEDG